MARLPAGLSIFWTPLYTIESMKQTIPWIVAVILGVLLVGSRSQLSSQPPTNSTGRFQIVGAEHNVGGTPSNDQGVVFRIDTQTGEVSTYEASLDLSADGRLLRFGYWRKVDEKYTYHDVRKEAKQATEAP
jgi:hypothetical protein